MIDMSEDRSVHYGAEHRIRHFWIVQGWPYGNKESSVKASNVWLRNEWSRAFWLMSLMAALEVASAQPSKPAPESWKLANPQLTKEAQNAYQGCRLALVNLDYRALVRTLADNALPLLPKDRQTKETIEKTATQLQSESAMAALKLTRQIQVDVDAHGLAMGSTKMLEVNNQNARVLLVRMPLIGTRELAVRHHIDSDNWTIDENGDLCVLMVKHERNWYWNPFGW